MLIYNAAFIMLGLLGLFQKSFNSKVLLYVVFFFLLGFFGFRFEVGADWFNYLEIFERAGNMSFFNYLLSYDVGYSAVSFLIFKLTGSYAVLVLFCSFFSILGVVLLSSLPRISASLFIISAFPYLFMVVGVNYIRQAVALSFMCFSIYALHHEKFRWGLVFSLISMLFHFTGILSFFLLFFVRGIKIKTVIKFAPMLFVLLLLFYGSFANKLAYYSEEFTDDSAGVMFRAILYSIPFLIYFTFFKKKVCYGEFYEKFILGSFCIYLLSVIFIYIDGVIADRLAIYSIPAQCLIFSMLDKCRTSYAGKALLMYLVFMFSFVQMNIWLYFSVWASKAWIPYSNILVN